MAEVGGISQNVVLGSPGLFQNATIELKGLTRSNFLIWGFFQNFSKAGIESEGLNFLKRG
jgi:hypothetical protein